MSAEAPLGRSLCSISDVTRHVPAYDADDQTQETLQQLIESVSIDAYQHSGREFVSRDTDAEDPVERRFEVGWFEAEERELYIGDLAGDDDLEIVLRHPDGTDLQTLAAGAYVLLPRAQDRDAWDPVTAIRFPRVALAPADPAAIACGVFVDVTGRWGFPELPANIREGVAGIVCHRYAGDPENEGTDLFDALANLNTAALFRAGNAAIDRYRVPTIA